MDHIVPHRGDQKLFWNRGNWQPLSSMTGAPSSVQNCEIEDGGIEICDFEQNIIISNEISK